VLALINVGSSSSSRANARKIRNRIGTSLDHSGAAGTSGADQVQNTLCSWSASALTTFVFWDALTSKITLGAATGQRDQNPLALVVGEASGIGSLGGGGQSGDSGGQGDDGEDELHVGFWLGKLELVIPGVCRGFW